jgi:hypothetical protein
MSRPLELPVNPLARHLGNLLAWAGKAGGAPDHDHQHPGRWDSNGRECVACRTWCEARAALTKGTEK